MTPAHGSVSGTVAYAACRACHYLGGVTFKVRICIESEGIF